MKAKELEKEDKAIDAELAEIEKGLKASETAGTPPAGEPPKDTVTEPVAEATPVVTTPPEVPTPAPVTEINYQAEYERLKPIAEEAERLREEARIANERYAAVNGKYMAEMPRMRTEVERLKPFEDQILTLQTENQDLKTKLEQASTVSIPTSTDKTDKVIERIRDEHGDEFADIMKDFRDEIVNPLKEENTNLRTQIAEIKKAPSATTSRTSTPTGSAISPEESFFANLTMKVLDWPEINKDPKWLSFLVNETEPTSGLRYQDLLSLHQEKGNVGGDGKTFGVADIFDIYKKKIPDASTTTIVEPPKPKGNLKGLEEHIDPSTVGGNISPANTKKTYSQAEIDAFDQDIMKGRAQKTMTPAEIQARLTEYDLAAKEGRVR